MTTDSTELNVRERVKRALVMNALTDWRGGIVLAIAILLAFFGPDLFPAIPAWAWLIGGGAAWGAIVWSILNDEKVAAQVAADLLKQKYEPTTIKSGDMREKLIKAFEYRAQIAAAIARARKGVLRDHLEQTATEIDDWIGGLWEVARRVDTFETDRTIQQDLQSVPVTVRNLEVRVKNEPYEDVRKQIEETLATRRAQLESLQALQQANERGKLQIDQTLSSMGTVYSQLLLMDAKDIDSGKYQRLQDDIAEEVKGLHEIAEAMDEVYQHK
ncbi:MAG: hypothetical protein HGB05_11990 [Chloroflexi bacterium]|nr:hypothetical protein [Chloroflexota bacterium]